MKITSSLRSHEIFSKKNLFFFLALLVLITPAFAQQAGCCCDPVTRAGSLAPATQCPQNFLFLTNLPSLDCTKECQTAIIPTQTTPDPCTDPQSRAPQQINILPVKGEHAFHIDYTIICPADLISIERCTGTTCTTFKEIAFTPPSTGYTDNDPTLEFNTNYTYRISTLNTIGKSTGITAKGNLGDLECLFQKTTDQFCLSKLTYDQYKGYLTTFGYLGKTANDFINSFDTTVTTTFNTRFNNGYACDQTNRLIGPTIRCGQQTCVSDGTTTCITPQPCITPDNTFGLLSSTTTCEGPIGSPTFCFLDKSATSTNKCYPCSPRMNCYDYKSKTTCQRNPCSIGQCEWHDLIAPLSIGTCVDTRFNNCPFCDQKGSQDAPNKEAFNTIFDHCTPPKATALSTPPFPCFFTPPTLTQNARATDCSNITCTDYTRAECSTPPEGITLNTDNSIRTPSTDPCGIHICDFTPDSGCRKNADNTPSTTPFWEDCNLGDRTCEQDFIPPETVSLPVGTNQRTDYIRIRVTDKRTRQTPATPVLGLPNYTTLICVNKPGDTPCTPTTTITADTLNLNDITLKLQQGTTPIADLIVGQNILRIFSTDNQKNKEVIKQTTFTACQNCAGPQLLNLTVSNSRQLGQTIFTGDNRPRINLVFNKPTTLIATKLTTTGQPHQLTTSTQPNTHITITTDTLTEGEHLLSFNAQDQNGFPMSQPVAIIIHVDTTTATLHITPPDGTIINDTSTPVILTFSEPVTLDKAIIQRHSYTTPFVDTLIPTDVTTRFATNDNTTYRLRLTGISSGPTTIDIHARDLTGRNANGNSTFFLNTQPTRIRLAQPTFGVAPSNVFTIIIETTLANGRTQGYSTPPNTPTTNLPTLPTGTTTSTTSNTPPPPTPSTTTTNILDFSYLEKQLTINTGDTITWTNKGNAPHTITSDDNTFTSGTLTTGNTFQHTFTTPGTYTYHCKFHPSMTATVTVRQPSTPTGAATTGMQTLTPSTSVIDCRYAYDTPTPPATNSHFFLPTFDNTTSNQHILKNFNRIQQGDTTTHLFHVLCKDTFGTTQATFPLRIDNTPPHIITAFADPTLIAEEDTPSSNTYRTTLKVQLDEEGFCKYSTTTTTFDLMENNFPGFDQTPKKTHLTDHIVTNQGNHNVNIACKNLAGLTTQTQPIRFTVDTTTPFTAKSTTPSTSNTTNLTISILTNKRAFCNLGRATTALTTCMGSCNLTTTHLTTLLTNTSGTTTLFAQCTTANGGENSPLLTIPIIVDTTPPFMTYVKDDGPLTDTPDIQFTTNRFRAAYLGNDTESNITHYLLRLDNNAGTPIINWTPSNRLDGAFHDLTIDHTGKPFTLQDKQKYTLRVKPLNIVGLTGTEATSNGATIDISKAPPACSNNLHDGTETDIDCGGTLCTPCDTNKKCRTETDCQNKLCNQGICEPASCNDNTLNGDETDTDCGASCTPCTNGNICITQQDCASKGCNNGICGSPNTCTDEQLSPTETDIDCGGLCPQRCNTGQTCAKNTDCTTGTFCVTSTCTTVTGTDTDNDGIPDLVDACPDTTSGESIDDTGCSTCQQYSTGDDIPDCWRTKHFGCITCPEARAEADNDLDSLTNFQEYQQNTNPTLFDTDSDGYGDGDEVNKGYNPIDADSYPGQWKAYLLIILIILLVGGAAYLFYYYYTTRLTKPTPPVRTPTKHIEPILQKQATDKLNPLRTFMRKPETKQPEKNWLSIEELTHLAKNIKPTDIQPTLFKKLQELRKLPKKEQQNLRKKLATEPTTQKQIIELHQGLKDIIKKKTKTGTTSHLLEKEKTTTEEREKRIKKLRQLKQ